MGTDPYAGLPVLDRRVVTLMHGSQLKRQESSARTDGRECSALCEEATATRGVGSATAVVLFHGSAAPFDRFDPTYACSNSGYSNGVLGQFFTGTRERAGQWGVAILEAKAWLKTPFVVKGAVDDPIHGIDEAARRELGLQPELIPGTQELSAPTAEDHRHLRAVLEEQGYDSIVYNGPSETTVVLFEPEESLIARTWTKR